MFSAKDVMADIRACRFYVEETKTEKRRMIQFDFTIRPLTPELAADISPAMQHDLFTRAVRKGEAAIVPRSEMYDVKFKLTIPHQAMTLRMHPDLESGVTVGAVEVRKVRAVRGQQEEIYNVQFETHFERPDRDDLLRLTEMLGNPVALSFEKAQPTIPMDPNDGGREARGTLH